VALVLAAAAAAHGARVVHNLPHHHWEDLRFFRHSRTQIHSLGDCFLQPSAWPGLYRPLSTNVYYFVGRKLFDNRIEPFHVVSAVAFLANGVLLFRVARELLPGLWALVPPVLFVSRFAHVQVATYGSEFQALSSTFFSLLSIAMFIRARGGGRAALEPLSLLAFALALLCKETTIAVAAIIVLYGVLHDRRGAWPHYLAHPALAALWVAAFALVFRRSAAYAPTGFDYDVSAAILPRYAAYLLVFSDLLTGRTVDMAFPERVEALASSLPALLAFLALLAAEGAAILAARGGDAPIRAAAFGFGWFLAGMAPFVILRDRLFMRYTYFGHAGLAIAAGALVLALSRRARRAATVATPAPAPP
jgi:hypothetical protein